MNKPISILMEMAMFPTDKGVSVSEFVSKIIKMIRESGHNYKLTPMGTIIEADSMEKCQKIISTAYQILEPHSERIYCTITFDIRKGKANRLEGKIASIEKKIGAVRK